MMGFIGSTSLIIFIVLNGACSADLAYEPLHAEDEMKESHGEIIFSAMLFRHGDRNPVATYPKNPHNERLRQAGRARLTQGGKERAYKLGIWARKRYAHLIQDKPYHPKRIHVMSSDSDRTISSAQLFLAGFFPAKTKKEKWNENIAWQPIPVFSTPSKVDRLLRPQAYCARYTQEVERIKNDPKMIEFHKSRMELYELIAEKAEIKIPTDDIIVSLSKVSAFYDTLYTMQELHLEHPDWVTEQIYPHRLRDVSIMYFKMHTFNHEMRMLKGGPLLEHIINELKNKRDNPQSPKIFQIYSGHDATLIGLMDTLGVYKETKAHYSASLLIELRILNGEYIITVSYRNVEDAAPQLLPIPGCPGPCSFDNFITVTKPSIPKDWVKLCETLDPDYNVLLY